MAHTRLHYLCSEVVIFVKQDQFRLEFYFLLDICSCSGQLIFVDETLENIEVHLGRTVVSQNLFYLLRRLPYVDF